MERFRNSLPDQPSFVELVQLAARAPAGAGGLRLRPDAAHREVCDIFLNQTSAHHRVFPSEGNHGAIIAELVAKLASIGYAGDFMLDVTNDDYLHLPAAAVAGRARNAARWTIDSLHPSGRSA